MIIGIIYAIGVFVAIIYTTLCVVNVVNHPRTRSDRVLVDSSRLRRIVGILGASVIWPLIIVLTVFDKIEKD